MRKDLVWALAIVLLLTLGVCAFAEQTAIVEDTLLTPAEENIGEAALQEEMEAMFAGTQETEAIAADGEILVDEEQRVFNLLVIGTDERHEYSDNARGDACMLLSLDRDTGDIRIASFERALGVPILEGAYAGEWDWLTHAFEYGGAELMLREIRENFKVDVENYVRVNMRTLVELIDKIGGIDIELTHEEVNYINKGFGRDTAREVGMLDDLVQVSEGTCRLNGATTLVYARCRKIDSDWKRVERQRKVMIAVLKVFMEMKPVERIATALTLIPYVKTNLDMADFETLARFAAPILSGKTAQLTVPVENSYGHKTGMGGRSMFSADFDQNSKALHGFIYGEADESAAGADMVLTVGSKGEYVKLLQQILIEEGCLKGGADGVFGNKTAEAVARLQKKLGMEETGVADAELLEKIFPRQ